MLQHGLVIRLLFFGMGKEEVGFAGEQFFLWNFFDAQQDVAVGEVLCQGNARLRVFAICETAVWRGLYCDLYVGIIL